MQLEEYIRHVDSSKFDEKDYGKWVLFSESYPPIRMKPYHGVTIEFLLDSGNPTFDSVFLCEDGEVRFKDIDTTTEALVFGLYENLYWRFVPDPPGNYGYNVG